jgi:hypothetical protein
MHDGAMSARIAQRSGSVRAETAFPANRLVYILGLK